MNLTITNDMTINYVHAGQTHTLDRIIFNNGTDHVVYERGGGGGVNYEQEYLHAIAWQDNSTIQFYNPSHYTIYYSTNKTNWSSTTNSPSVTLNRGEKVYYKANITGNLGASNNDYKNNYITSNKLYEVAGNFLSLFYGDNFTQYDDPPSSAYYLRFLNGTNLLSIRNLYLPTKTYSSYRFRFLCDASTSLIYGPKKLYASTSVGSWPVTSFFEGCSKVQETPVMYFSFTDCFAMLKNSGVKRFIWLGPSGYPSNQDGSGYVKYKLSTNNVSGTYIDFDTLQANNSFISIWAEAETPYDGYIEGCSDYFVAGDTVTLTATNLNGTGFQGWYEDGQLVSSSSTYTFTASTSRKLTVKFS